jgi:hypothetical protein
MYKIVLEGNPGYTLIGNIKDIETAKERLKEMIETDKYLAKYYNWSKLPRYLILEEEESEK